MDEKTAQKLIFMLERINANLLSMTNCQTTIAQTLANIDDRGLGVSTSTHAVVEFPTDALQVDLNCVPIIKIEKLDS